MNNIYWYDLCSHTKYPNILFIFGKILNPIQNSYESICIQVHSCQIELYFKQQLQQQNYQSVDLEIEAQIKQLLDQKCNIHKYTCEHVKRYHIFNNPNDQTHIGSQCDCLKVCFDYPTYQQKQLLKQYNQTTAGVELYGLDHSMIQNFILKHNLMGPGWISITNMKPVYASQKLTNCTHEYMIVDQINNIKHVDIDVTYNETIPTFSMIHFNIITNSKSDIVLCNLIIHLDIKIDGNNTSTNINIITLINSNIMTNFNSNSNLNSNASSNSSLSVITCQNEKDILLKMIQYCHQCDIIAIFDSNIYTLFLQRINYYHVQINPSCFIELPSNKWNNNNNTSKFNKSIVEQISCPGKILIHIAEAVKEFVPGEHDYSLKALVDAHFPKLNNNELDVNLNLNLDLNLDFNVDNISQYVDSYIKDQNQELQLQLPMNKLIQYDCKMITYAIDLLFKFMIIPLTKYITNICGNIWNRTLQTNRSERIAYLLLHDFYNLEYILPEKKYNNSSNYVNPNLTNNNTSMDISYKSKKTNIKIKSKAKYEGGLVLEPKKGNYETIVILLDFNSLYPSIIQEYNICFSTIEYWNYKSSDLNSSNSNDDAITDNNIAQQTINKASQLPTGRLPKIIYKLVQQRRDVQKIINKLDPILDKLSIQQLSIRQKALKLTSNTTYGVLGLEFSLFYCEPIAALITRLGRDILKHAVSIAEKELGLEVVYGDTDSIGINTRTKDVTDALHVAQELKDQINKHYKILEIEIDSVFKQLILYGKKKYVGTKIDLLHIHNTMNLKREIKGMELVRRDWCPLVNDITLFILNCLENKLDNMAQNIYDYLETVYKNIKLYTSDKFVIIKSLSKPILEYENAHQFPHLQAAAQLGQSVHIGDLIPYIMIEPIQPNVVYAMVGNVNTNNTNSNNNNSNPVLNNEPVKAIHYQLFQQNTINPTSNQSTQSTQPIKIDYNYYITKQICPAISRLCEPIKEIDIQLLEQCLGIHTFKSRSHNVLGTNNNNIIKNQNSVSSSTATMMELKLDTLGTTISDIQIECPECKTTITFSNKPQPQSVNSCTCIFKLQYHDQVYIEIVNQLPKTSDTNEIYMQLMEYEFIFNGYGGKQVDVHRQYLYNQINQYILQLQAKNLNHFISASTGLF